MFKNLRIGVRRGLGFGAVLVLMSLLAFTAFTRLAHLNQEIEFMVNDRFPNGLPPGQFAASDFERF